MTHLPGHLPQGDSAEGIGEPLQGELPGKEGSRSIKERGDNGRVLDPFYSRPTQYVQDLMSEITATRKIQYSKYERLYEYYALIQGHIMEARKANLEETLLTQANIALMEQPLHMREIEEWRNRQAKYAP